MDTEPQFELRELPCAVCGSDRCGAGICMCGRENHSTNNSRELQLCYPVNIPAG